jgi:multidrug efflux pump subunit AcrA (membrane-fusion protein)
MMPVRAAESLKRKADAQLTAAERAVAAAGSAEAKERAEDAKAKATATAAEVESQVAAAKAELQPKLDAAASAREAAVEAEKMRAAAAEAAREAARQLEPVSVFISRKTQRLYVRQAFQPILESPITIQDADRPIGTHVFTAMERIGDADMRWSVVTVESGHPGDRPELQGSTHGRSGRDGQPIPSSLVGAKAALDRIAIPQDVLDRIAGMVSPRSSLIISDEAFSPETGKGTEFIVLLSGEPQGGIKFRRRGFVAEARYERQRERLPYERLPYLRFPFARPW